MSKEAFMGGFQRALRLESDGDRAEVYEVLYDSWRANRVQRWYENVALGYPMLMCVRAEQHLERWLETEDVAVTFSVLLDVFKRKGGLPGVPKTLLVLRGLEDREAAEATASALLASLAVTANAGLMMKHFHELFGGSAGAFIQLGVEAEKLFAATRPKIAPSARAPDA